MYKMKQLHNLIISIVAKIKKLIYGKHLEISLSIQLDTILLNQIMHVDPNKKNVRIINNIMHDKNLSNDFSWRLRQKLNQFA